jgi:hypothetical protein
MTTLRNAFVALAALATVSGATLATTSQAEARPRHLAGAIVGGLVVGALLGAAAHAHSAPSYGYGYAYRPARRCFQEPRYNAYGHFVGYRSVCSVH